MPACDHCGKVVKKVQENANGRTVLRLCPLCQAEYDFKYGGSPGLPPAAPKPWWRRLLDKLQG